MLEGLYSAAAGMEAQQTVIDGVGNDLANVDTPGYQGEVIGFHDLLYSSAGPASSGSAVATGAGAAATQVGWDQSQGATQQTGNPLDVAINGPGFLQVRRPDGTLALTRNGSLQLSATGQLTTTLGMPLQPPITVPPGTQASSITIGSDGTVGVNGRAVGQIQLVTVASPDNLIADGSSLYSATAASGATRPATGATLQQGALTASNVDLASAMTAMVNAEQGYNLASRAIQYQDQMLQIANQLRT
jgi:flagellar basal-body rod protein FlgG